MKIVAIVDNKRWCWTTTAQNLAMVMPEHQFIIVPAKNYSNDIQGDMVWCRGYASTIRKRIPLNVPVLWTMTTGGKALKFRIEENKTTHRFVICQCRQALNAMQAKGYQCWLVPNGVDCDLFKPSGSPPEEQLVGFAGNMVGDRNELKGIGFVEDGCRQVGIGFRMTTSSNPLAHSQMADWYRGLWIYAQPSESEGCSNSVMEAMACGLPCLICDGVGYHGEVCRDGINYHDGQVVFVQRDPADIAEKIAILRDNPHIYHRIRNNARDFAEGHRWKFIGPKMNEAFRVVVSDWNKTQETKATFLNVIARRPFDFDGKHYRAGDKLENLPEHMASRLIVSRLVRREG